MAKLLSILAGKESPRVTEMTRTLEKIGAEANSTLNKIDRHPDSIDYLTIDYPKTPVPMNGATSGIVVQQREKDQFCQTLTVTFGKMAFSPAHKHPHYCVCLVLSGEIHDTVRGRRFDKGDWYLTMPEEVHSAQSIGGAVVTVFNTYQKNVAESIINNHGYDSTKIAFDKLKFTPQ